MKINVIYCLIRDKILAFQCSKKNLKGFKLNDSPSVERIYSQKEGFDILDKKLLKVEGGLRLMSASLLYVK